MNSQNQSGFIPASSLSNLVIPFIGPPKSRSDVLQEIKSDQTLLHQYKQLSPSFKEEFLSFCMGIKGVKMTYDPFFKYIFDPLINPERLEQFLSYCLKQTVVIVEVMPNESRRFTEDSSLLVVDMIVRLKTGVLVNVEIQRVGYLFPAQRCACYSSDLLMRQYAQIRARHRRKGTRFSYRDIQKVYTIVLMQKSTNEFHLLPNEYLHYGNVTFNTNLKMELPFEYLLIPLDIFLKIPHNKISRLDAWLYFIASDNISHIMKVVEAYPEFQELYKEVFQFRFQLKELIGMFSEALRILDANTVQYMIEEQQKELDELKAATKAQRELVNTQNEQLSAQKKQLNTQTKQLAEKDLEIQRLKALLGDHS